MALNQSTQDNLIARRALVAKLRLHGLTLDQIALGVAKQGFINPRTGKPYSKITIKNDLDALKKEWREEAASTIEEHQARQFQEIQDVKQMAYTQQDGTLALRAIDLEMKLLGTKAPDRLDVNMNINYGLVIEVVEAIQAAGDDYEHIFTRLKDAALARANERS